MKNNRIALFFLVAMMAVAPVAQAQANHVAESVDTTRSGWVASVLHWYDAHMNYLAVGGLMTLESSFIPFPSEVVIPPAVYVALDEKSQSGMNWWLVVLFGTLGALLGAFINYFLSMWLGRPISMPSPKASWDTCCSSPRRRCSVPRSTSTTTATSPP